MGDPCSNRIMKTFSRVKSSSLQTNLRRSYCYCWCSNFIQVWASQKFSLIQIIVTYLYHPTQVGFTHRVKHSIWPSQTRGASGVVVPECTSWYIVLSAGAQSSWTNDLLLALASAAYDTCSCRPLVRTRQCPTVPSGPYAPGTTTTFERHRSDQINMP